MPSVTVLGAGHETVTLTYDSAANAEHRGTNRRNDNQGYRDRQRDCRSTAVSGPIQMPPPLPHGKPGEFVQTQDGLSIMLPGYKDVVVTAASATVLGSGDANEAILSSEGKLTFIATGGSGTVVAGGASAGHSHRGKGDHGSRHDGGDLIIVPGQRQRRLGHLHRRRQRHDPGAGRRQRHHRRGRRT